MAMAYLFKFMQTNLLQNKVMGCPMHSLSHAFLNLSMKFFVSNKTLVHQFKKNNMALKGVVH